MPNENTRCPAHEDFEMLLNKKLSTATATGFIIVLVTVLLAAFSVHFYMIKDQTQIIRETGKEQAAKMAELTTSVALLAQSLQHIRTWQKEHEDDYKKLKEKNLQLMMKEYNKYENRTNTD